MARSTAIEPQLYRYPAIDPAAFRRKVRDALDAQMRVAVARAGVSSAARRRRGQCRLPGDNPGHRHVPLARDSGAILVCVGARSDDWGREFQGPDEIRGWSDREFIGVDVSLEVTAVEQSDGATTVTATVGGRGFSAGAAARSRRIRE